MSSLPGFNVPRALFGFIAGTLFLHLTVRAASAALPREYDILRSFPPGRLAALTANDMPDPEGLTGSNRVAGRWVEAGPQRGSCRAVIAAVVADDLGRADRAWRGIEVAFSHQRPDGSFDASQRPNGPTSDSGPAAVETSYFFLQELGRAILVIRQSPHAAHFKPRIDALEPQLRKACDFILAGEATILPKSRKAVNRVLIAAKAFGTCGLVLGDDRLVAAARRLVGEALRQRDDSGVFLEHGGRDSSYNAVSLLFGQVLALHVPLPELDAAMVPAARWQASRVLVSGEVDNRGNTRTGVGLEPGYNGQPKGINYNEVIFALTYHGLLHRDPVTLEAAERAFAWTQRESNRTRWLPGTNNVVLDRRPRQVLLDLPPGATTGAPLLLAFHGFTGSATALRDTTGLADFARSNGWVVAWPEGSRDALGRSFFQVGYAFHTNEAVNDLQAMNELAGRLVRDLGLEPRAVFATGFSNGADFSYLLAVQPVPFVAAIAPVAGTLMSRPVAHAFPSRPIPILAVHSLDDTTTRWNGDRDNKDGWGAYLSVPEVRTHFVHAFGLDRSESDQAAPGIRRHRNWKDGQPGQFLLYELSDGGHRWPPSLGEPGMTTAQTLRSFFDRQRRSE